MWVEGRGELPGQLVVVSGPSGSGKSSVIRRALERAGPGLALSVSATTRAPRPGEAEGRDYHFVDKLTFQEGIVRGEFMEWADYNGSLYGTPAGPVYDRLAEGNSVLLEIEVNGALQVRRHAPGAFFIFVRTPSFKTLEERLRGRGTESDAVVMKRLRRAREELAEAHWYDARLVNDDFDRCVDDFLAILNSPACRG